MSRQTRRRPLELEAMEGKMLLSTMRAAVGVPTTTPVLDGNYTSNVKSVKSDGATNPTITELFNGSSKSLGRATGTIVETVDTASSTLTSAGFTIQNAKGSVHISFTVGGLISHTVGKKSSNEVLAYTVDGGTGAYAGATGHGTFSMTYIFKTGAVQAKLHSI